MTSQQQEQQLSILKPLAETFAVTGYDRNGNKLIYLNLNRKLEIIDLLDCDNGIRGCIFPEPAFVLGIIWESVFNETDYVDYYLTDKEKYFFNRGFLTTIKDFIYESDYRRTGSTFIVQL